MTDLRKIDALVAEHVMGYRVEIVDQDNTILHYPFGGQTQFGCPPGNWWDDASAYNIPLYSTDIAAAWQVVEKLVEKEQITLASLLFAGRHSCAGWDVEIFGTSRITVVAPTAPLAICLAALQAKGVSVDP